MEGEAPKLILLAVGKKKRTKNTIQIDHGHVHYSCSDSQSVMQWFVWLVNYRREHIHIYIAALNKEPHACSWVDTDVRSITQRTKSMHIK